MREVLLLPKKMTYSRALALYIIVTGKSNMESPVLYPSNQEAAWGSTKNFELETSTTTWWIKYSVMEMEKCSLREREKASLWKCYQSSALQDLVLTASWELIVPSGNLPCCPAGGMATGSESMGRGRYICPAELEALTVTNPLVFMSILWWHKGMWI